MFSYTRAKRYDKKHRDLLNQNIVVSFYDNNEKQFYTKNDVRNFFEDNINDVTASIQNNLSESLPEGFRIKPIDYVPGTGEGVKFDEEEHYISVISDEYGIKIGTASHFLDNLDNFRKEYEQKVDHDGRIYGEKVSYRRINRYILFPIKTYYKDKILYLNMSLETFTNKSGIIKIDIPLEERNIEELYDYEVKNSFSNFSLPMCLVESDSNKYEYVKIKEKNIDEIINNYYIPYIFNFFDMEVHFERGVESLLITQTSVSLNTLNSMSSDLQESLYRILHRPIDTRIAVNDKLNKIKQDYWGSNQIRTYFSDNGNSLSLTVSNFPVVPKEYSGGELARRGIKYTLDYGLDMPLKIMLLKRLNNQLLYKESTTDIRKIEVMKEHYLANKIYISNLTEEFYGSALDLMEYINTASKWYLNERDIIEKNSNTQELILSVKDRQKRKRSEYLTVIGFVFTVIFALPTLKESFEIGIKFFIPQLDAVDTDNLSRSLSLYSWTIIIAAQVFVIIYFNVQNITDFFRLSKKKIINLVLKYWSKIKRFFIKLKKAGENNTVIKFISALRN